MDTRIGRKGESVNGKPRLNLTSSGFWAYTLQSVWNYYSVNNVTISTHRNFVEHTIPGRKGSKFQDMGRPAIKIVIEGNINESSIFAASKKFQSIEPMLKELHTLCDYGQPLEFRCDMPALFDVNRVVITDLEATEVRGRKYDYDYKLTLKEWSEDEVPVGLGDYMRERKSEAWKKIAKSKKAYIIAAAAVAVPVYYAARHEDEKPLVVSIRLNPARMRGNQQSQITVIVSDSKGARIKDAKVDVLSRKGTEAETTVRSGLTTDASGLAIMTFPESGTLTAGVYTITAKATCSGYADGKQTSEVTVE